MNKSKYHQEVDFYPKLINKDKYKGRRPITIRSSWEKKFIKGFLDPNKNVIEWNSEDVVIPYLYSVDGRYHRYFTDFYFKVLEPDGIISEHIVEIKPSIKLIKPKTPKRKTKSYKNQMLEYYKNQDKFKAARSFVEKLRTEQNRNIDFRIITEKELKI